MIDFSKLSKTAKQRKVEEFLGTYALLCKEKQLQFMPRLELKEGGIFPKLDIVEYKDAPITSNNQTGKR